jgi:hypothetical protein
MDRRASYVGETNQLSFTACVWRQAMKRESFPPDTDVL